MKVYRSCVGGYSFAIAKQFKISGRKIEIEVYPFIGRKPMTKKQATKLLALTLAVLEEKGI
jgi:hypothetical protein